MKLLDISDRVHPLKMSSEIASCLFPEKSLDMIFIDGDHIYKGFKTDLELWFPKLKVGGLICGHDCECKYSELPVDKQLIIDNHLDTDYISGFCHPGVVKSLWEKFQDKYIIKTPSVIWCKSGEPPARECFE
jgi:hypothetical protein